MSLLKFIRSKKRKINLAAYYALCAHNRKRRKAAEEPTPTGLTWDEDSATATTVISPDGLTASNVTPDWAEAIAKALPGRNSGVWMIGFTAVYPHDALEAEVEVFLVPEAFDPATGSLVDNAICGFTCDGRAGKVIFPGNTFIDRGIPFLSGEGAVIYVDDPAGHFWCDNASEVYKADAEAGINPHGSFTPGTALAFATDIYIAGGSGEVSVTMNPTLTSGRFGAYQ